MPELASCPSCSSTQVHQGPCVGPQCAACMAAASLEPGKKCFALQPAKHFIITQTSNYLHAAIAIVLAVLPLACMPSAISMHPHCAAPLSADTAMFLLGLNRRRAPATCPILRAFLPALVDYFSSMPWAGCAHLPAPLRQAAGSGMTLVATRSSSLRRNISVVSTFCAHPARSCGVSASHLRATLGAHPRLRPGLAKTILAEAGLPCTCLQVTMRPLELAYRCHGTSIHGSAWPDAATTSIATSACPRAAGERTCPS